MTAVDLIAEITSRQWTVTFPAFIAARSFKVQIRKGEKEYSEGWINDGSLVEALTGLSNLADSWDAFVMDEDDGA